ncbi:ethanolamine ammonia-lyase, large subunit [Mycobacteroides abscessus]|nr:ethanolamine ammonia-lyase, large subunit [Mycobacteroides abscessus]
MKYRQQVAGVNYAFDGLVDVMAKATPLRSGDELAGCAAASDAERAAAAWVLADLPLDTFLNEAVVPYESDEVTRLIIDSHDRGAYSAVSHLTVVAFGTGCWKALLVMMGHGGSPRFPQGSPRRWRRRSARSCAIKT